MNRSNCVDHPLSVVVCRGCAEKRIRELEAENARLKDQIPEWMEGARRAESERDEAQHELEAVRTNERTWKLQFNEALAACAAKDEAIKKLRGAIPGLRRDIRFDDLDAFSTSALSSTANSELLMRLEKAEDLNENHRIRCEAWSNEKTELLSRLEKAEAVAKDARESIDRCLLVNERQRAQLESMRAVLEECLRCAQNDELYNAKQVIRAALSHSAPRLYRNQILEEAKQAALNCFDRDRLQAVAERIDALKEGET